jgi:hypothetical protein
LRLLTADSRAMRGTAPIFIVGEARSGTSILYRTLQQHPTCRGRDEDLTEANAFALMPWAAAFRGARTRPLYEYMLRDDPEYEAFLRSLRALRPVFALGAPFNQLLCPRSVRWWRLSGQAAAVRSYFFHAHRARGAQRLLEKTPNNLPYVPHILSAFPDAKVLYMCRHPVDVLSSYRRRREAEPDARWCNVSVDAFCRRYESGAAQAIRFARQQPASVRIVRYEDFTRRTAPTLRAVCEFLDLAADEARTPGVDPMREEWRVDPYLFAPITPDTKRWYDHLEQADAAHLERRLAPTMRFLGYEPYTAAAAVRAAGGS